MDDQQAITRHRARLHEMHKVSTATREYGLAAAAVCQVGVPSSPPGFPTPRDLVDSNLAVPRTQPVKVSESCGRSDSVSQETRTARGATKVVLFP